MTDKEKQIEEMAQAIFDYVDTKNMHSVYICGNKTIDEAKPFLHNTGVAKFMYEKGYRKQSDTAKEIIKIVDSYLGTDPICRKIAEKYGINEEDLCD